MKLIQFGGQYGGGGGSKLVAPLQRKLNTIFFDSSLEESQSLFSSVEHLSIVLRVSGPIRDFGYEGPERLKKVRGKEIYTIDLTVPEYRWADSNEGELKEYLSNGIQECFYLLVKKIEPKEANNLSHIESEFKRGLEDFLE